MKYLIPGIIFTFITIFSSVVLATPNETDLGKAFSEVLPEEWVFIDFEVDVSENYGTKVEPLWKFRFVGEAKLKIDTYTGDRRQNGVLFLKQSGHIGQKEKIFGIATAKRHQGEWEISFQLDEIPFDKYGKPRKSYKSQTVIIGTSEEKEYYEEIKRREAVKEKAKLNKLAELNKIIETGITSGQPLKGGNRNSKYNRLFRIDSFNKNTGMLIGTVEHLEKRTCKYGTGTWCIQNAINRMEGSLSGVTLILNEVEAIQPGIYKNPITKKVDNSYAKLTKYTLELENGKKRMEGCSVEEGSPLYRGKVPCYSGAWLELY